MVTFYLIFIVPILPALNASYAAPINLQLTIFVIDNPPDSFFLVSVLYVGLVGLSAAGLQRC